MFFMFLLRERKLREKVPPQNNPYMCSIFQIVLSLTLTISMVSESCRAQVSLRFFCNLSENCMIWPQDDLSRMSFSWLSWMLNAVLNVSEFFSVKNDGLQIVWKWPYKPAWIDGQQHLLFYDYFWYLSSSKRFHGGGHIYWLSVNYIDLNSRS